MFQKYFELFKKSRNPSGDYAGYSWWHGLIVLVWVWLGFYTAQFVVIGIFWLLNFINVPIDSINKAVFNFIAAALVYVASLAIVILLPWFLKKHRTKLTDIGLNRLPFWSEVFIAPAGFIIYLIFSSVLILIASNVLPWFDINQVQTTGFESLNYQYQYILAFLTLVVIAPIAEEILFRGYLYGKLRNLMPIWVSIILTSLLFGAVHGAWNLAVDTFALSIILCLLREMSGSIWASILLHMLKNGLAFYILFISPLLLTTLGR